MRPPLLDRTWVEIDLDALAHNIQSLRQLVRPGTALLGVIKADAYGHGAVEVAHVMEAEGVDMLAVSMLDEALELRQAGIKSPLLLLSYSDPDRAEELIRGDIAQAAYSWAVLEALNQAGARLGRRARVHIKLDTGMGRIGFPVGFQSLEEIEAMARLPYISLEGIFTHFATADEAQAVGEAEPSDAATHYLDQQFMQFFSLCQELERKAVHIPLKHCCNSPATLCRPAYHMDMVRPGGLYYGFVPPNARPEQASLFRPVMALKSRVIATKTLPVGASVSYGRHFSCHRETRLLTVPIGYADGYPRALSGRAEALIAGHRLPQVGRICMDAAMFDATDLPFEVEVGQVVTLVGHSQGADGKKGALSLAEVAAWAGTIDYEIACSIGKRVPRLFLKNGEHSLRKYICEA